MLALATATVLSLGAFSTGAPSYAAFGNVKYKADIATPADVDYFKATLMAGEKIRARVGRAKNSALRPTLQLENLSGQSVGIQLQLSKGRAAGKVAAFPWKTIDASGTYQVVVAGRNGTAGAYDAKFDVNSRAARERETGKGTLDAASPRLTHTFQGVEGATVNAQIKWGRRDTPLHLVSVTDPGGQPVPNLANFTKTSARKVQIKRLPLVGRLGTYTMVFEQVGAGSPGKVEGQTGYNFNAVVAAPRRAKDRNAHQLTTAEPQLAPIGTPTAARPGTNVSVHGQNFSADDGIVAWIGDKEASVRSASDAVLELAVPEDEANATLGLSVINADGQTVTEPAYFVYQDPSSPPAGVDPPPPATQPAPATLFVRGSETGASDTNAGTASSPLKTIQRALDLAGPGDVISVGPGRYPESLVLRTSGTASEPIILRSDPPHAALIDGSEPITNWTRCASAAQVGGNANYGNIFVATLPAGVPGVLGANLYEGSAPLMLAQWPRPSSAAAWDDTATMRLIPTPGFTGTQIKDPTVFREPSREYWDGAWVALWTNSNEIVAEAINSYDPSEGRITFDSVGSTIDAGRDRYAVLNHASLITGKGDYVVGIADASGNRRVYLWPHDESSLSSSAVTASVRKVGIDLNGRSHAQVRGFEIRRFAGDTRDWYLGAGILNSHGHRASHVTIRNNVIKGCKSATGSAVLSINDVDDVVIDGNTVEDCLISRGISVLGSSSGNISNADVHNNVVRRVGGTGIVLFYASNSSIRGNSLEDLSGVHANGITAYLSCYNIKIDGNRILRGNIGITVSSSEKVTVTNNLIVGDGSVQQLLAVWGQLDGPIKILHNTFLGSDGHGAISIPTGPSLSSYTIENNITDGMAIAGSGSWTFTERNNIFTGLNWQMSPSDVGQGSSVVSNMSSLFVSPSTGDFHLRSGSAAIGVASDLTSIVPKDISGKTRSAGSNACAGAYQY